MSIQNEIFKGLRLGLGPKRAVGNAYASVRRNGAKKGIRKGRAK